MILRRVLLLLLADYGSAKKLTAYYSKIVALTGTGLPFMVALCQLADDVHAVTGQVGHWSTMSGRLCVPLLP